MIMRLLLVFLLMATGLANSVPAQEEEYEDLWVLYIDEDYEKLVGKALKITENDKTRKQAMPYLFVSMGYYEMSKREEFSEDYPKALKDAGKYAARWRKKDKESKYVYDNKDFIADLRAALMEEAEGYLEDEKISKAKGYYKYMVQMDPENPGSWLAYAYAQKKMNDFSGSTESMEMFEQKFGDISKLDRDSQRLLKYALIVTSEDLYREGKRTEAKEMIGRGADFFKEDREYSIVMEDLR
jgi:tetratricopeptide (TPR) repeat protein